MLASSLWVKTKHAAGSYHKATNNATQSVRIHQMQHQVRFKSNDLQITI